MNLTGYLRRSIGRWGAALLISLSLGMPSFAQQVWFSPNDPTYGGAPDVMNLFAADAPWSMARSTIQVYKMTPNFVSHAPQDYLRTVFAFLKQYNIKLAIEWGILTKTSACANSGVEGYSLPGEATVVANRIKLLGGDLAYVAMDEPLFFGHYYTGANACHSAIADIARDAATNIALFRAIFPNVQIGDIEPVDAMPAATWQTDLQQWLGSYATNVGQPMAFFHDDPSWNSVSLGTYTPALIGMLQSQSIPFGIIFDGGPGWTNSDGWMVAARNGIRAYNAGFGTPAQTIFQTWYPYPDHMLPESDPTAFTSLLDFYFSPAATQAPVVGFLRLYNPALNKHFYTASAGEASSFIQNGWRSEGVAGRVYTDVSAEAGMVPLFRLYNATLKDYFFTTSTDEKNAALSSGYADQGNAAYVFATNSRAGRPLYGAYNTSAGHFYTPYLSEYNSLPSNWTRLGVVAQTIY